MCVCERETENMPVHAGWRFPPVVWSSDNNVGLGVRRYSLWLCFHHDSLADLRQLISFSWALVFSYIKCGVRPDNFYSFLQHKVS